MQIQQQGVVGGWAGKRQPYPAFGQVGPGQFGMAALQRAGLCHIQRGTQVMRPVSRPAAVRQAAQYLDDLRIGGWQARQRQGRLGTAAFRRWL
jgi:hypothetical protein